MNTDTLISQTFLEKLRKNTSQSHIALEELPVSKSIMDPAVTDAEYGLYLSLMHDVVKDAEGNIFPVLTGIIIDMDERKKSGLLENDLKLLGYKKDSFKNPLSSGKYENSRGFALGILYVVEGSSLGGRVILKNIKEALGRDENTGAEYFAGYGGQTGSRWKSFLEMMTRYEAENKNADEIIAGADYAFKAITKHFTENTPG